MIATLPIFVSVIAFLACGWDKASAGARGWRVPQRVLLLLALCGGSPGLLVGVAVFQHKTRSPAFLIALAGIILLQFLCLTG